MVTSKKTIDRIKDTIARRYRTIMVSVLGGAELTAAERKQLEALGQRVPEKPSLLELAYYHNILNAPEAKQRPTSVEDMWAQQKLPRQIKARDTEIATSHADEAIRNSIERLKTEIQNRVVALIQDNNQAFRMNSQAKLVEGTGHETLGQLKRKLRDLSHDANRDWDRISSTEMSNVIGYGSVDRILAENTHRKPDEVYCFRLIVSDTAVCAWCRKFYLDPDGTPAVYRLSDLLSNGSNYGRKKAEWLPVVGATHPRERCSGIIQLRPGWAVRAGGNVEFIGPEAWESYIQRKVRT